MKRQESELREYVIIYKDLVHPNVVKMVQKGDREGIKMALNHIHYNSLRESRTIRNMKAMLGNNKEEDKLKNQGVDMHDGKSKLNFKNALVYQGGQKQWVQKEKQESVNKSAKSGSTVFVHNLSVNTSKLEIWKFMRKWGRIQDCITPVKRDKWGKRYGFVKLQTTNEAENFIKGINGKMLVGNTIRAQFANKDIRKDFQAANKEKEAIKEGTVGLKLKDNEIASDISKSLVVTTWKESTTIEVLNSIELLGHEDILVRDLIVPRKLVLECLGLPITLWKLSNFIKLVDGIGEITAISRLMNEELCYQIPKLEVETKELTRVKEKVMIEYEGKNEYVDESGGAQEGEDDLEDNLGHEYDQDGDDEYEEDLGGALEREDEHADVLEDDIVSGHIGSKQEYVLEGAQEGEYDHEGKLDGDKVGGLIGSNQEDGLEGGQEGDLGEDPSIGATEDKLGDIDEDSVVKETQDTISPAVRNGHIWFVREDESSPVTSVEDQLAFVETNSASTLSQIKELSSSGSFNKVEEQMTKLKLGRKRGRPPKRKTKKGNQAFALSKPDNFVFCKVGSSEAEQIYESCLQMGLIGQVIVGRVKNVDQSFVCINVYGPQHALDKIRLWSVLKNFVHEHGDKAVCLIGDFNCVRNLEERKNCIYRNSDSNFFNDFIESSELFDVRMVGSGYTWCGPSAKQSRLDRVLANWEFFSKGDWKVEALGRMNSDHRALHLFVGKENWGAKPFKVFDCWLNNEIFLDRLKEVWKVEATGNFHQKIRHLRKWIAVWNKNENGNIEEKIRTLEREQFQAEELGEEMRSKDINVQLERLYDDRAKMWLQKARIQWQQDGDRNTKYFHNIVKYKWSKNKIRGVLSAYGEWVDNPEQIKEEFYVYFKNFFKETHKSDIFLLGTLMEKRLSDMGSTRLMEDISMGELEYALKLSPSNKAPGPDGFDAGSLKKIWEWIKDDLLACVHNFMSSGILPGGFNSSFIALVPKCASPQLPKDYRPISLINAGMKLVTKVLALRLNRVLSNLVSEVQSGFMQGRQISDGILLVSEIISSMKSKKCRGVILKLDFEKAFDSVNWDFLLHLLRTLNFHDRWIRWIEVILKTSRISVLINGSPSKEFSPGRGLRQGDPLSPLLFNLVGEVLHCMLERAERAGIFQGIQLGNMGGSLSHLQYADDRVIFVSDNSDSINGVKRVLLGFELLTGLRINFAKSSLYCFNSCAEDLRRWAGNIGCQVGSDSFQYLGLERAKSPNRIQFWDPLVSKVRKKLADWKSKTVSTAGRVILLQAVLDSLPIYWFNMFLMPRAVENQLEKIRRRFFWGTKEISGQEKDNMRLIAWEKICRPRSLGGVGIMKVKERNIAMLGKWWWRCINERDRFWNKTLQSKYGSTFGVDPARINLDRSSSHTLVSLEKLSWSIKWNQFIQMDFALSKLLEHKMEAEVKEAWQIVVSATIWTIWLFRNALIFNECRAGKMDVLRVLRLRIFRWLEITKLVSENMESLFWVNPKGAIKVSASKQFNDFWESLWSRYDWVVAVDGAFTKHKSPNAQAGIGGVIKSSGGNMEYVFSGPSKANQALDAEKEACLHVLGVLAKKMHEDFKVVICSDSAETISYLEGLRYDQAASRELPSDIISASEKVVFKYVSRRLNIEADGLAKAGINRPRLAEGWV
ncbi:hypothetical protein DCAR_0623493 [Daucus carota subsp. sativus]|uniref:Reverse transcriptase domain-containing protein n=1 Tax=Daucus carota subsp. sativus TaxID=79200 RepID=A0AAF1B4V9_DAUCS|nr:hypothetical protein DCAR_0623493 [Daucus carota subsp. sativus]